MIRSLSFESIIVYFWSFSDSFLFSFLYLLTIISRCPLIQKVLNISITNKYIVEMFFVLEYRVHVLFHSSFLVLFLSYIVLYLLLPNYCWVNLYLSDIIVFIFYKINLEIRSFQLSFTVLFTIALKIIFLYSSIFSYFTLWLVRLYKVLRVSF